MKKTTWESTLGRAIYLKGKYSYMRNKGSLILYGRVALPLEISKEGNVEYVVCVCSQPQVIRNEKGERYGDDSVERLSYVMTNLGY